MFSLHTTPIKIFFFSLLACSTSHLKAGEDELSPDTVTSSLAPSALLISPEWLNTKLSHLLDEESEPHESESSKANTFILREFTHIMSQPDLFVRSPLHSHFNRAKAALKKCGLASYDEHEIHPTDRALVNGLVALYLIIALENSSAPKGTLELKSFLATVESVENGEFDSWWAYDALHPKPKNWAPFCAFLEKITYDIPALKI